MKSAELQHKKIAIAGYGVEGKATAEYLDKYGAEVTVLDHSPEVISQFPARLGTRAFDNIDQFDLVVRSPGVRPDFLKDSHATVTATNLFLEACPAPVIGVTGTKGKGTISALIAQILHTADKKVHLGGNIGIPALSFLDDIKPDHVVVLELSSFQLIDLGRGPDVAVVGMIDSDHLNWHEDHEEYVNAKAQITNTQRDDSLLIYNAVNSFAAQIAQNSPAKKMPYLKSPGARLKEGHIEIEDNDICSVNQLQLLGPHNAENACAAVTAAWQFTKDVVAISTALQSFSGLPHRLEDLGYKDNIRYINDSFSTNPAATIAALRSFNEPLIPIIGGFDKHGDYEVLVKEAKAASIKSVILIGQIAQQLKQLFDAANVPSMIVDGDIKAIVAKANEVAEQGDVVLLSPATSSFDMFENYKKRGDLFRQAVAEL